MARISPLSGHQAPADVRLAFDQHLAQYKTRITNTKATLAKSLPSFRVYMQWFGLFEELKNLLGRELAVNYAYAVSHTNNSPLCAAFFRKLIIDGGQNPEDLVLTADEEALFRFGSAIARTQGHVADHVYNSVASIYSEDEIVLLVAFAGQMIATNVFNNVIETDIDAWLAAYREPVRYA